MTSANLKDIIQLDSIFFRDVLIKPILVKPEGFPVEKDFSKLACPSGKFICNSSL